MTLASFVPDHQEQKLALITELKQKLGPALEAKARGAQRSTKRQRSGVLQTCDPLSPVAVGLRRTASR